MLSLSSEQIWTVVRRTVVIVLTCGMLWALGTAMGFIDTPTPNRLEVGEALPHFELPIARKNGLLLSNSAFASKGVLLNFFDRACKPCDAELSILKRLHKRYAGAHFEIVGVTPQDPRMAQSYLDYHKVVWPSLLDRRAVLRGLVGIPQYPTSIFVSPGGVIVGRHHGALTWKVASNATEKLIIQARKKAAIAPIE